jgi:hypothetical protein
MPMNAITAALIRRNWPLIASVTLLILFLLVHQLWFRPTAQHYARALKEATDMGMPLDPYQMPRIMPPRLFARIADNSLPVERAQEAANSGQLTAEFMGELAERMGRRNLTVIVTEPGPTTNGDHSIQLHAHVRARGRYPDFVMLLDDLARDTRLYGIDRFVLSPEPGGLVTVELWAGRLVLKGAAS